MGSAHGAACKPFGLRAQALTGAAAEGFQWAKRVKREEGKTGDCSLTRPQPGKPWSGQIPQYAEQQRCPQKKPEEGLPV